MRRFSYCIFTFLLLFPLAASSQGTGIGTGDVVADEGTGAASIVMPEMNVDGVVDSVIGLISALRMGSVIAAVGMGIMLLVSLLKLPALGGLVKKIPARWRIIIPISLGGVAGILFSVQEGTTWQEALVIGLFSGPTAVFAHELFVEALLGKRYSGQTDAVES